VLLLNPDSTIEPASLRLLVQELEENHIAGAVAPQLVDFHGRFHHSLRRFPRLRSTYSQALFLHRLFPRARWADEVIRRREEYLRPGAHEWVSGACILVRRPLLEQLDGLDERFFLYCEDTDLCLRIWKAGYEVRFQPDAKVVHEGGASAERSTLLHVAAASRISYAQKHRSRVGAFLERVGIGLGALTHMFVARGGSAVRAGHARALRRVTMRAADTWPDG
jgi:GT2 family glycosyltransferase